jgi:hypothetical protein
MNNEQFQKLVKEHLEVGVTECRWCFAVDMKRVKGERIATHNYPDATLVHLSCPRCGGEFTFHFNAWGEDYLKSIISKLHPELGGRISDELFKDINNRVSPEYLKIR